MHSDLPLVEPYGIADIFISGIADLEDIGDGQLRMLCYARRKNTHTHEEERVVVASLIMSRETLVRNMFQVAKDVQLSIVADVSGLPKDGDRLN